MASADLDIENLKRPGPKSLLEMREEVHVWAKSKGWWDGSGERCFGDLVALMHSELSEALEAYRVRGMEDMTLTLLPEGQPGKPEGAPSELADLLIRLLDVCGFYEIDLEAEYERKMAYNRTRPYRHGGKRL